MMMSFPGCPASRAVRRLPFHGHVVSPRRPVHAAPHDLHHAPEIPAGLHIPTPRAHATRPPLHGYPGPLSYLPLGHQDDQVDINRLPAHGKYAIDYFFTPQKNYCRTHNLRVCLYTQVIIDGSKRACYGPVKIIKIMGLLQVFKP